ncbi:MAG: KH domain-containing protein [Nitriliruptorales bacterium]|nr:KH domain-containing protein [Nitriliruptorales bacterium]
MSGPTVEEAVGEALRKLGLERDAVDVEVITEPRKGLFGTKPAVVVVRERLQAADSGGPAGSGSGVAVAEPVDPPGPATAAPTDDLPSPANEESQVTETDTAATTEARPDEEVTPEERLNQLDQEADLAADFVEGLLDRLDLPGDIEIEITEEQAMLNLEDVGSGLLIGRRGATLDALQELVRCAVQRQTERRSRVRIDVEGYRSRHVEKLRDRCREAIAQVRESGEPVRLEPMDAYERKLMHDLVAKTGGVTSSSEGTEPKRRVVIHPDT